MARFSPNLAYSIQFSLQPSSSSVTSMHAIRSPSGLNAVVTAGTDMRIR